jgi:hypothetical protein
MAIPSSRSIDYDAVLSLSLEYIRPRLVDNIFSHSAFLAAMYGAFGRKKRAGRGIRLVNGGERIRCPLMYGKNTTVGSYSGYDTLDVTPQDGITTAFYNWKQLAGSIAISRREERQNAGEGKIRDLLQAKVMQTEMSLREDLNYQLLGKTVASAVWTSGSGIAGQTANADYLSLPVFIPRAQAQSASIGNINGSTYSWWRPYIIGKDGSYGNEAIACTTWDTLKFAARRLYNKLSIKAGGPPDIGIMDESTFESYEMALDEKTRYVNNTDGPVTVGFDSIRFKSQDLVWDEFVPDMFSGATYETGLTYGSWFMLNTEFMEMVVDSQTNFLTTPFVRPENQDAKVAQILQMGALTCSNRSKQGAIHGITLNITS